MINFFPKKQLIRYGVATAAFIGLFCVFLAANAAPADTLNYQGKLTDTQGAPVADTNYDFKLTLWDSASGGTCLWSALGSCGTPTAKTLATKTGIFSTELGASGDNALSLDFNSDVYLQIQVNTDSPMSPRRKVNASAYSLNTKKLDGQDSSYYLNASTEAQTKQGDLTVNGDVTVGNSSSDHLVIYGGNSASGDITTTSGSMTLKPQAGQNLSVSLSASGDLAVNTNQLYVDTSTGNVGIGTISPSYKLTVYQDGDGPFALYTFGSTPGGGSVFRGFRARGTGSSPSPVQANDVLTGLRAFGYKSSGGYNLDNSGYVDIMAAEGYTGANEGSLITFGTTPTGGSTTVLERMRIDASGNVGIGTASPNTRLQIEKNASTGITDGLYLVNRSNDWTAAEKGIAMKLGRNDTFSSHGFGSIIGSVANGDAGMGRLQFIGGPGAIPHMTIAYDGKVGIGTANPSTNLHILNTSAGGSLRLDRNGHAFTGVDFFNDATAEGSIRLAADRIVFEHGGVGATYEKMRITSDGNVGIGTTNPQSRLDVRNTNSFATVGSEMIVNAANRDFSSSTGNWTGTNWSIAGGVATTHVAGANSFTLNNAALTAAPVAGNTYQITFDINTTVVGTVTPSFGGFGNVSYGQFAGSQVGQTIVVYANSASPLTFTPNGTWTGTIDNVSVKQITISNPKITVGESAVALELRGNGSNSFLGFGSGRSASGSGNSAFGYESLFSNTTGLNNSALGSYALISNTTGSQNTAVGSSALYFNATGSNNSAVGESALLNNVIGTGNSALGNSALSSNTTGTGNTAVGYLSLFANTTANYNTAVGYSALRFNTTGNQNSAFGNSALYGNTTGSSNSALGNFALYSNNTGTQNSGFGYQSLYLNTTGNNNTAVGYVALNQNSTGSSNTASGVWSLYNNVGGSSNVAMGHNGLLNNTYGSGNVALGFSAGVTATSANANTTGGFNIFLGHNSGGGTIASITNGSIKTASVSAGGSGYVVGDILTISTGTANATVRVTTVSSGAVTGFTITGGGGNYTTGVKATTGGTGTGCTINVLTLDLYNSTVIGYQATSIKSNSVILGNSGDTNVNVGIRNNNPQTILHVGNTGVTDGTSLIRVEDINSTCNFTAQVGAPTCGSDLTLKKDISTMTGTLNIVTRLNPVAYHWKTEESADPLQYGFIAQEVEALIPGLVTEGEWIDGSKKKFLTMGGMMPYVVGAIKEQQDQITQNDELFNLFKTETQDRFATLFSASSEKPQTDPVFLTLGDTIEKTDETLTKKLEDQKDQITILLQTTETAKGTMELLQAGFDNQQIQLTALMDFYTNLKLGNFLAVDEKSNLILPGNLTVNDIEAKNVEAEGLETKTLTAASAELDNVSTKSFAVKNEEGSETIGSAEIPAGETKVTVKTKAVGERGKVFVSVSGSEKFIPLFVSEKKAGEGFEVRLDEVQTETTRFDWWVVDER